MDAFNLDLKFQSRFSPIIVGICRVCFPGCRVAPCSLDPNKDRCFDQELSLDKRICLPDGSSWTLQHKIRRDGVKKRFGLQITQELFNNADTPNQSEGEWFHLYAQLYLFGWAVDGRVALSDWLMMDVARYKRLVAAAGGLSRLGTLERNDPARHGTASFYAIDIAKIKPACLFSNIWPDVPTTPVQQSSLF